MAQADGTKLVSRRMVSTMLCMRNREFQLDAEVLSLGGRQLVIGLSWLRENGFILDPVNRTLENKALGCVVQCSDASLRYSTAFLHRYFFTFTLSNNLFRSSG